MVDPDRVRRLLQSLDHFRSELAILSTLDPQAYLADHAYSGRYLVQAAAQSCIDVANHVIASEGWRTPADFRDAFTVLEEHHVLEPALAERLRALAGLRNRLVHLYEDVDDGLVQAAITEGLPDLEEFQRAVARLLTS